MTWYRTGTVTVTNGSVNVTLAGGDALQNIFPDDGFVGPDGKTYAVNTIGGAGAFTLQVPYTGATAAGQAYVIIPVADYVQLRSLLTSVNSLITQYQDITIKAGVGRFLEGSAASPGVRGIGHEGTGLVWNGDETLSVSVAGTIVATFSGGGVSSMTFPNGTVGIPAIRFANDTNTGFYRYNADIIGVSTGGADQMQFGASGHSTFTNQTGAIVFTRTDGSRLQAIMGIENGGLAIAAREGLVFATGGGGLYSVTVERMRIDTIGRVGMGTNVPATALHVANADPQLRIQQTTSNATPYGLELVAGGLIDASFKSLLTTGEVRLSAGRNSSWGGHFTFVTDTIEKVRITSAGNVGIGSSSPSAKLHVKSTGEITRIETTTVRGSGQNYIAFNDPSGAKGYVGYPNANDGFDIQNNLNGPIRFTTNGAKRLDIDITGNITPGADNAQTMGWPSARWTVIYAVTGTINTSDEREKNWIGEASPSAIAAGLQIIDECGFFTWIDGKREHFGPRAQRVWAICAEHGLVDPIGEDGRPGKTPLAFLCYDEWKEQREAIMAERTIKAKFKGRGENRVEVEPERVEQYDTGKTRVTLEAGNRYGVRTDQLNMFMTAALNAKRKEQDTLIANLAATVAALETKVNSL